MAGVKTGREPHATTQVPRRLARGSRRAEGDGTLAHGGLVADGAERLPDRGIGTIGFDASSPTTRALMAAGAAELRDGNPSAALFTGTCRSGCRVGVTIRYRPGPRGRPASCFAQGRARAVPPSIAWKGFRGEMALRCTSFDQRRHGKGLPTNPTASDKLWHYLPATAAAREENLCGVRVAAGSGSSRGQPVHKADAAYGLRGRRVNAATRTPAMDKRDQPAVGLGPTATV